LRSICRNGQCEPINNEEFIDNTHFCGKGECFREGVLVCRNGEKVSTCEPYPPAQEICDGKDNDCDGVIDNGVTCQQDSNPCTVHVCRDGSCAEEAVVCPASSDSCMEPVCVPNQGCGFQPITCEGDAGACRVFECQNGQCNSVPRVCTDDDDNLCTVHRCIRIAGEDQCVTDTRVCEEDDDDCSRHVCRNNRCEEDNICNGPIAPPLNPPPPPPNNPPTGPVPNPPQPVPPPQPVAPPQTGGSTGAATGNTFPGEGDADTVVVGSGATGVVTVLGLTGTGMMLLFGLVASLNNTKKDPPLPAVADMAGEEMADSLMINPTFQGTNEAMMNVMAAN